jgi:FkbM family methyltransferase
MNVGRRARDAALAAARWEARNLRIRGTGRVMNYVYPRPGPDDAFIETVEPYQGGLIQIDTRSYIEWSIFCFGAYDRATVELLTSLVHPGCVVLDVGANVGVVTLPLARLVGPQGAVHAFEPHPEVRRRLRQNIALNNLSNVHVCESALGPAAATATLHSDATGNEGAGSLAPGPGLRGQNYAVEVDTLDSYAADLPDVHLLKIDTEGADYGVLEGARDTIERRRPAVYVEVDPVLLERFDATPLMIFEFLKAFGYEIWRNTTRDDQPYSWGLTPLSTGDELRAGNWLAVAPDYSEG